MFQGAHGREGGTDRTQKFLERKREKKLETGWIDAGGRSGARAQSPRGSPSFLERLMGWGGREKSEAGTPYFFCCFALGASLSRAQV